MGNGLQASPLPDVTVLGKGHHDPIERFESRVVEAGGDLRREGVLASIGTSEKKS